MTKIRLKVKHAAAEQSQPAHFGGLSVSAGENPDHPFSSVVRDKLLDRADLI
jgi:hypothetical protein